MSDGTSEPGATATALPLCVDLDGTLCRTDTLHECLAARACGDPLGLLRELARPWKGRADFKRRVCRGFVPDPASLPWQREFLRFLAEEKQRGRKIILATGADREVAEAMAKHLGLFDEILASDGEVNLTGRRKAEKLAQRFGEQGFDYAGNSRTDNPVFERAGGIILVNVPAGLERAWRDSTKVRTVFQDQPPPSSWIPRQIRVHQWLKNALLFIPSITAHRPDTLPMALLGFISFCGLSSMLYLLNDMADLRADRRHPAKRLRPLACGDATFPKILLLMPVLLISAALPLAFLPRAFGVIVALHLMIALAYSAGLKRVPMLDVVVLSALYTLRILAAGAATGLEISHWLLAFSTFFFLSLAFLKRYAELLSNPEAVQEKATGRGYILSDLPMVTSLGASSGYMSVLVFTLYLNSETVKALYRHPQVLWLACIPLLYGISRIWLLARRGIILEDPAAFVLRDSISQVIVVIMGLLLALAALPWSI